MKECITAVFLGLITASAIRAQNVFLESHVLRGVTNGGADVGFVGIGLKAGYAWTSIDLSAGYRYVHTLISCKTSLPPLCNSPTPAGDIFTVSVQRALGGTSGLSIAIGLEAGLGRFLNQAETDRDTWPLGGVSTDVRVPVGRAMIKAGGVIDWTRKISFLGAVLGVAVAM